MKASYTGFPTQGPARLRVPSAPPTVPGLGQSWTPASYLQALRVPLAVYGMAKGRWGGIDGDLWSLQQRREWG